METVETFKPEIVSEVTFAYICTQIMEIKERIIKRSEELFMRYGIRSVTMDDIARDLGVSKKTLYAYFDNKTDLVRQIIKVHMNDEHCSLKDITSEARDAVDEILNISKFVIAKLRNYSPNTIYDLKKYYRECWVEMEAAQRRFVYAVIKNNISRGVSEALYRPSINPDIIAKLFVGKTTLVVDEDLFPLEQYNKQKLFQEYITYHIHGIASEEGLKALEAYQIKEKQNAQNS